MKCTECKGDTEQSQGGDGLRKGEWYCSACQLAFDEHTELERLKASHQVLLDAIEESMSGEECPKWCSSYDGPECDCSHGRIHGLIEAARNTDTNLQKTRLPGEVK
jgi:hypothetical protein